MSCSGPACCGFSASGQGLALGSASGARLHVVIPVLAQCSLSPSQTDVLCSLHGSLFRLARPNRARKAPVSRGPFVNTLGEAPGGVAWRPGPEAAGGDPVGHSVRQAATSAIQINPAPTWIRPVLVVSIPLRRSLARLPCGGATEMMQRHSIVSWYSLGCGPWGARHLWPWIRDRPPPESISGGSRDAARACICTGAWRASVLRGLMQSWMDWLLHGASVRERGSRQATTERPSTPLHGVRWSLLGMMQSSDSG